MEIVIDKWMGVIIALVFGMLFGSFATMASYRIPRGEDLVVKRSGCPSCGHHLGFLDLFPLFSWLFNLGKCRYCKVAISCRYPLTEAFMATLFVMVYLIYGFTLVSLPIYALVVVLVIITVIDFEHQIIPDILQIAIIPIGILYRYNAESELSEYFTGPLAGLFISLSLRYGFWLWKKKEGLGMGDVKFFAVAGLFLGIQGFVPFMLMSGLMGIFTSLIWKKLGKGPEFPFAPALIASLLLCILFPEHSMSIMEIR